MPSELLAVERVGKPVGSNLARLVFDERIEPLSVECDLPRASPTLDDAEFAREGVPARREPVDRYRAIEVVVRASTFRF